MLPMLQPRGESLSAALEAEAKEYLRQEIAGEDPGKFVFLDPVTHKTISTPALL